jgi:predicted RecB family nuclease
MAITITDELIIAFSQCPLKAYHLAYSDEHGQLHEYQKILEENRLTNQHKHFDAIKYKPNIYPYSVESIKKDYDLIINARLIKDELQADCDILTKVDEHTYEPAICIGTHSINDTDKLRLMFVGYVLAKIQEASPVTGRIITMDGKTSKVKLQQGRKILISLLQSLQEWATNIPSPREPPIILNKHCLLCQFKVRCDSKAVQEDNLSRLNGVTPRMIRKYERKGIFTVKQLSYLFKPRKKFPTHASQHRTTSPCYSHRQNLYTGTTHPDQPKIRIILGY